MTKSKSNTTYRHKYQHYCFEMECHPDDSPEELESEMNDRHLED